MVSFLSLLKPYLGDDEVAYNCYKAKRYEHNADPFKVIVHIIGGGQIGAGMTLATAHCGVEIVNSVYAAISKRDRMTLQATRLYLRKLLWMGHLITDQQAGSQKSATQNQPYQNKNDSHIFPGFSNRIEWIGLFYLIFPAEALTGEGIPDLTLPEMQKLNIVNIYYIKNSHGLFDNGYLL